jgi:hypothetical protein
MDMVILLDKIQITGDRTRSSRIAIENANQGHFAVSAPNSPPPGTQILGTFASLLGLLGIFLYFTGWIYRWAYFGWFSLEINRLDLPLRSFLFVPIQVFCGDFGALLRTFLALVAVAFAIQFTLWILSPLPSYSIVSQSGSSVCVMQWTRFISDVTLI